MPNVTLRYKGMNCFGVTDGPGSDEIYVLTFVTTMQGGQVLVRTEKHPVGVGVYEEVDAGDSFGGPIAPCYIGPHQDMSLGVTLMEHDQGDPNAFQNEVDSIVTAAAVAAAAAGVPVPEIAQQALGKVINFFIDSADDLIDQQFRSFTAAEVATEAGKPQTQERNVSFTFLTDHRGLGATYKLYFDFVTEPGQDNWRFCGKCMSLFFDGDPNNKGTCPGGAGHSSIGLNFSLPHDLSLTPNHQSDWRFCGKCMSLFFDGDPNNKGTCPGGAGHSSIGFTFSLPHS